MKLVVMGDFHYPRMEHGTEELLAARDQFFSGMLKAFLDMEADYHISLGDFANEGYPEEFVSVFEQVQGHSANRRFIHVLGNHDAYTIPKTEILMLTGQQRYHSISLPDADLIFLDTTKEMNRKDYGGDVDDEQTAWLDNLLQQSSAKPVAVFGHHPIPNTTSLSDKPMLCIDPHRDLWPVLQRKAGSGYYFCGHNHVNSIAKRENWHFIQTAACLDVPAFRVVDIQDGAISVDLVHIKDEKLVELAAMIGVNMKHFKPKPIAPGEETDWSLHIVHVL